MAYDVQSIHKVRPKLSLVSPLVSYICWGYAAVNVLLGLGMYFLYLKNPVVPIAVANIFSYQVWGIIFAGLGIITAFGLVTNNWVVTKNTQIVGVLVKTIWLIALIIRCFISPQSILITAVWFFLTYIQVGVYLYFLPAAVREDD